MINLRNLAGTALALAALLAACGVQNVPIDAELSVSDHTVVYDGQPQQPEITFDPPGTEIGAEFVITPEGGPPLESGMWPTDAGVYTVVVRASADHGGREVEGTLTIEPRPIEVAPDAGLGKVFGAGEPSLTFAFVDPSGEGIVPSSASGVLGREVGESVGTYAFTLGDLEAGANFALALEDGAPVFTIAASGLGDGGIVVSDATVVFDGGGQSVDVAFDPPAAGTDAVVTYGELAPGVLPVDAGTYAVSAVAGAGYVGTATGTLVIMPRPIVVAPDAGLGKVFGAAEPSLTYAFVDPAGDGIVPSAAAGALDREAGESLGTYSFMLGDLDAGANFALALEDGAPVFTIAASDLGDGGIVVSDATVVFDGGGQSVDVAFDPPAAGTDAVVTYGELAPGVLPVDAGTYAVSVVAGTGYVGGATGSLTIVPRPVNLVPSADQGKEYGAVEPTYAYAFVDPTGDGVVPTSATGALVRDAGESVSSYEFTIGDLDAGANFAVTLIAASFEITPRALTLSGFSVDDKTYDGSTVATGATFLDDRLDGDDVVVGFDVAFSAASAGTSVLANFTGLSITGGADAGNYALTTTSGSASAEIARRALSVDNVLWADKVYDGGTGATASATLVTTDVVDGDAVALVSQLIGEFASADVGTHAVAASFALTGADAANYVVDPQPNGTADIDVRLVTLDDAVLEAKTYDATTVASITGTLRPASGFDRGVLPGDVAEIGFAGAFAQADASVDPIAVTVSLTGSAATNYALDPVPALSGAIAPAVVTVTPDTDQAKTYGDADPEPFGFVADGLIGEDATAGVLTRVGGESVGSYAFELGTLAAGANYSLVLAEAVPSFAIAARPITLATIDDETVYGALSDLSAVLVEGSDLRTGDVLVGSLARPDATVGTAAYTLDTAAIERDDGAATVDVSANYTIDFGAYAVLPRPLTITAVDRAKTYGDVLELGTTDFVVAPADADSGLIAGEQVDAVVLASEGAAAGATVVDGPYAIVASDATGTLGFDANNYAITYLPGGLAVEPRVVTVSGTFSVADKAYDGSTEAGTVDASGLVLNNLAAGDDVGFEAVASFPDAHVGDGKVASLTTVTLVGADASNYSISLVDAPTTTGSMVKADVVFGITIAGTDFATEVVYDGDRTYQPNVITTPGPMPVDVPIGYYVEITYDRTGASVGSFNPVGTYTVAVTADDPRYVGSSTQVVEVLARPITIASSATDKTYGTLDPAMFPSLADGTTFGRNEAFFVSGALTYRPGDQVTPYAVGTYPLDLGSVAIFRGEHQDVTTNYAITFASDFEIVPATVTVTPDADQGKVYGDADLTFGYTTEGFLNEDAPTGALDREDGEDVGSYAFTLGDLDAGANYALVLAEPAAAYSVVARPLTLTTADPAYRYGDTDLDLLAVLADGTTLREGDLLAGDLALSDGDAGTHPFLLGSTTLTRGEADVAANYALTFADYSMAVRPAIVTPTADQGKTYGDADPTLGYTTDLLDGDVLTGALGRGAGEDVATYPFMLGDLANPNYALTLVENAPTFAIVARPILLEATVASKHFSDLDPDLSPVLGGASTLRDGDALEGALAHDGTDVGTYPLLLSSVRVMRDGLDVGANYTITFGDFTIDPLPVAFDISNADLVVGDADRTHVFFGDGSEPIRGLTVAVTPDGATPNFRFSYLWTHDADHVAYASPIAVQRIQGMGTYQVTITATSANHVGATTLTVWVTDATGVAFAATEYEALVGATVPTLVHLVGPDGNPRFAGPVPVAVALGSDRAEIGFSTGGEPEATTTVFIRSGTSSADVGVTATALTDLALLTATAVGGGPELESGAASFTPTVQFAFEPSTVESGAGATSAPVVLRLTGHEGIAVATPSEVIVDLDRSSQDFVFRNAEDTLDVTQVVVPAGSSEVSFRMRSDVVGTHTGIASFAGLDPRFLARQVTFVVAPRPTVGAIEPASVDKAQTTDVVLTGTGFVAGVTVQFSGTDVTVDSVTVDADTQLTVGITIDGTTDVGTRDVTVTNLDGGTSTNEGALTLTVPTLTANDDGTFDVVEGGNHTLSIANDLLANDTWTGSTAFAFDDVVDVVGLTHAISGDALTVSAAAGTGGSTASLTYRIRDAVFGMTSTATVDFDVTLAPVDAILFTDSYEFEDFLTTDYTVPTFAEIFASWPRFSNSTYYADSTAWAGTTADAWFYTEDALGGRVVFPLNASYDGIVSPDAFEYYTHEATLYSTNSDDDSVGIIIALSTGSGSPRYLVANRSNGHLGPSTGWGLSYYNGSSLQNLVAASVPGFTTFKNSTGSGWQQSGASRVKVERSGDIVRIYATDWFTANVATATPPYPAESMITVDLATGEITYYDGFVFRTTTTANDLGAFRGAQPYGYFVWSQADTSYLNIDFAGGAAQDTAILLTAYDAQADAYGASQVWRFDGGLWTQSANDIQTELGFPRDVTSVASPNPASAYSAGYSVFGDRFRIEATTVRPIVD